MSYELKERMRSLADCDARAGEPLGKALREGLARIEELEAQVREMEGILRTVAFRAQGAKRLCGDGHPVSAYNLSSGILGQIGGHVATLTGEKP